MSRQGYCGMLWDSEASAVVHRATFKQDWVKMVSKLLL